MGRRAWPENKVAWSFKIVAEGEGNDNELASHLQPVGFIDLFLEKSILSLFGECKGKCCPFIDRTLGPYTAAVAMDDPLDRGQTNTGACEFAIGV